MKTNLLFRFYVAIFMSGFFIMSTNAQIVTCSDPTVSKTPDFWFNNFYFSKCTDYLNTGGKDITGSSFVDFNGGGTIVFNNIYVSADADYTARLSYGIGWADPVTGADFNLIVNDALIGTFTVFGPNNAGTIIDLPLPLGTLAPDWNNVIKIQQARNWPVTLGIQLVKGTATAVPEVKHKAYSIESGINKSINISGLNSNIINRIEIYSIEGKQISCEFAKQSTYTKAINEGIYLLKVNGETSKVVVK
jgi:hypothetical protein